MCVHVEEHTMKESGKTSRLYEDIDELWSFRREGGVFIFTNKVADQGWCAPAPQSKGLRFTDHQGRSAPLPRWSPGVSAFECAAYQVSKRLKVSPEAWLRDSCHAD